MIFKILRTLSSPTAMLKLEVSGKRKENFNKKVWTPGLHFLFVSKFASWAVRTWETQHPHFLPPSTTAPGSPGTALPLTPPSLVSPLPWFFSGHGFCLFLQVPSRESRHMCELQMKTVNKGRQHGSREQGGPCRHMEFIPADATLSSRCVWMPGRMEQLLFCAPCCGFRRVPSSGCF